MPDLPPSLRAQKDEGLEADRADLLRRVADLLDTPMLLLSFTWLGLLVLELTRGLTPLLEMASTVIWVLFILNFALEFAIAPRKLRYLRTHWLTAVSLLLPALRVFRLARLLRATRGVRLVKVVGSLNRGISALSASFSRRGFGYVLLLTALVTVAGAAGMHAFERDVAGGLTSYGEALWWTAMIMTTMGSQYWPETPEGRALCMLLALYGFAVFGYVTATLATYFVGRDAESEEGELPSAQSIEALRREVAALREELARQPRQ